VVDVANVMGARADGWWRDRSGAALRLGREVIALARRGATLPGNGPASAWVLVIEGQARASADLLTVEAAATAPTLPEVPLEEVLPGELLLPDELQRQPAHPQAPAGAPSAPSAPSAPAAPAEPAPPLVRVVSAPGSGDDAIVGVVAEVAASDEICLVVTADRGLRQRCEDLNAEVVGPGWLLRLL